MAQAVLGHGPCMHGQALPGKIAAALAWSKNLSRALVQICYGSRLL